jgi:hypothetical protein
MSFPIFILKVGEAGSLMEYLVYHRKRLPNAHEFAVMRGISYVFQAAVF